MREWEGGERVGTYQVVDEVVEVGELLVTLAAWSCFVDGEEAAGQAVP